MARVKLSIDLRRIRKDETYPIKVMITHKSTFRIGTDFSSKESEWGFNQFNNKASNSKSRNIALRSLLNKIENVLLNLDSENKLDSMSDKLLKSYLETKLRLSESSIKSFAFHLDNFISLKTNDRTKDIYKDTRDKVEKFDKDIMMEYMDVNWLKRFDNYMLESGIKMNTRAIHMRNIRAIFNYAIDEEIISNYPFRKFKIKKEETIKRSMTVGELRIFANYKCEHYQEKYRDLFMLTFYLIGINPVDLLNVKSMTKDRIEYYRAKTGKLYSIKVPTEAMDIINKYKGEGYLIDVLDTYKDYRNFTKRMNMTLKQIGEVQRIGRGGKKIRVPIYPDITIYHARHSWATIASELDIPKETISAALGHEIGSKITGIYIDFNMNKVDEANRRVIDYVLYGK